MKTIIITLIIIANFILQSTVLQSIKILNVIPNISLILVVAFAINTDKNKSALIGFVIGILQDIIFGKFIGLNALIYMVAAYMISNINKNVFKENLAIPFIFTVITTIFYYAVGFLFIYFLGYKIEFLNLFKRMFVVELIYNSFLSFFVYTYISKIFKPRKNRY